MLKPCPTALKPKMCLLGHTVSKQYAMCAVEAGSKQPTPRIAEPCMMTGMQVDFLWHVLH